MKTAFGQIKLSAGDDFLKAFGKLPRKQQKKVREFLEKFTKNPDAAGINFEKIRAAQDDNLRSVRIDDDYRGILLKPEQGNVFILLWVDKHDDAYTWARQRTCGIHPDTGTIQVVLTEEAAASTLAAEQPAVAQTIGARPAPHLFAKQTDSDLLSLGVPETMLRHVREVCDEQQFDRLDAILPKEAFEGLFLLAAGYTVEQVRAELNINRETAVDPNDYAAAMERTGSKRQFVVITDAAEMESILSAPLEQWRVFLHPSQRRLVEMSAAGPVRVLGSAGTGKTVVAMHRAVWLVRNACALGQKVLFTTFTKNLAADIAANLKKLCSHEEWERIEVVNLDAWAKRFLDKQGFNLQVAYVDAVRDDLWQRAQSLLPAELLLPAEFIRAEWDNVIQAYGIETKDAYLSASRLGRTRRLDRSARSKLWAVFAEYRALLTAHGLCEPADVFRSAATIIHTKGVTFPYRSIVVDEAQDFGNEAFRLVRALAPEGANDLFITGDAHQRIYGQHVVLSRCGINIKGRGRKLRINYRTTEEVKNWASGLLKGISFDDLDAGFDDAEGVRSLVHGEAPVIQACDNETTAGEFAAAHIRSLLESGQAQPEGICLVARTHRELAEYQKYVSAVNPTIHEVEQNKAEDGAAPGIRLATIHRVKGLEFDHVILVTSVDVGSLPENDNEASIRSRALLYVAATRARRSLYVCRISRA